MSTGLAGPQAITLASLGMIDAQPEERFDRITSLAQQVLNVPVALVTLFDGDRSLFKSRQGLEMVEAARTETVCNVAAQQTDTFVVEDLSADDRFSGFSFVNEGPRLRFYAGQPLHGPGGQPIGTLCVLDDQPRSLSAKDKDVLQHLAGYVQRELSLFEEFDRAAQVQRALLPSGRLVLPGYELAGTCVPSRSVGGDLFDWYHVSDGVAFTVADVMGKGMGAAILMATVRAVLRAAGHHQSPAAAIDAAASTLEEDLDRTGSFVTLLHARLDLERHCVSYVDAGHGLTLLLRADGTSERLASGGLPLGAMPGQRWAIQERFLGPGDTVVAFSDGVLDLFGGDLEGLQRLVGMAGRCTGAQALVDAVVQEARRAHLEDDVTVVVLCRTPDAAEGPTPRIRHET